MKMDDIYLRNEKIKKWVAVRKGRVGLLAQGTEYKTKRLYDLIINNRLTPELVLMIEQKQRDIEKLEKECIRRFDYFKRFMDRGQWRVPSLAKKLDIHADILRRIAVANGDGRYLLIKYGLSRVFNAIRECEKEKKSHFIEGVTTAEVLSRESRRKVYTLSGIQDLASQVKAHASYGNHNATVFFKEHGKRYQLLSVGFDHKHGDMCRSHVCDKDDPHVHATVQADLNCPKNFNDGVGALVVFAHSAPCPNCAKRLIQKGVSRVYCHFEPDLMGGLVKLAEHGIPVIKINIVTGKEIQINDEKRLNANSEG